jgi:predicted dehydrogenase
MAQLKGVAVGAGYFSQFHYEAWSRIAEVELAACCDIDPQRAESTRQQYGLQRSYSDFQQMLDEEQPDFVDIITRPEHHLEMCREAARRKTHVICQKPLAPTFAEAKLIVETTEAAEIRFMVHENFRFQPWHREIKRLLQQGVIGEKLHTLTFRSRPGDGWGEEAYRSRQPYFRDMQRFLVFETGIHFIDTFRYLAGEVRRVFCHLRKLNPAIAGEDCGLLVLEFASEAVGVWDANRYNESGSDDPRYTFGEFLVEGSGGTIRLAMDGSLSVQPLGQPLQRHAYPHSRRSFGGDCCYATQRHFVDRLLDGEPFETSGREYLKSLTVQEALYRSAEQQISVLLDEFEP